MAQHLLPSDARIRRECLVVRTVEMIRGAANENNVPAAFVNGFTDGQAARATNSPLTAYLRVGIDEGITRTLDWMKSHIDKYRPDFLHA